MKVFFFILQTDPSGFSLPATDMKSMVMRPSGGGNSGGGAGGNRGGGTNNSGGSSTGGTGSGGSGGTRSHSSGKEYKLFI